MRGFEDWGFPLHFAAYALTALAVVRPRRGVAGAAGWLRRLASVCLAVAAMASGSGRR